MASDATGEDGSGLTIQVVGYPGDEPRGEGGKIMCKSEEKITYSFDDDERLRYILDASPGKSSAWAPQVCRTILSDHIDTGNSGSPVFQIDEDGSMKVIGVHCYGNSS